MTTFHLITLIIGIVTLGVGLVTLIQPSITRRLLGIAESESATYALRIAGMMLTAFGLVLVLFIGGDTAGGAR